MFTIVADDGVARLALVSICALRLSRDSIQPVTLTACCSETVVYRLHALHDLYCQNLTAYLIYFL